MEIFLLMQRKLSNYVQKASYFSLKSHTVENPPEFWIYYCQYTLKVQSFSFRKTSIVLCIGQKSVVQCNKLEFATKRLRKAAAINNYKILNSLKVVFLNCDLTELETSKGIFFQEQSVNKSCQRNRAVHCMQKSTISFASLFL